MPEMTASPHPAYILILGSKGVVRGEILAVCGQEYTGLRYWDGCNV
jgi:hypothetical protein